MKKLPLIFATAVLMLATVASAQTKPQAKPLTATVIKQSATAPAPTGVQFTWTYTVQSGVPACPTGTTNTCVSGFTITDTTASATVSTPSTTGPTATSFIYTPATMFFGTHSFSIVVNGFDNNGAALTSSALTASVTNNLTTLNPPTGFTAATH